VAAIGCGGCSKKKTAAGPMGPPAMPVTMATAERQAVPQELQAIGTVEPFSNVQVKAQVAGELKTVHFREGQNVNPGDLLFEIDPRPYADALNQAQAAVERDRALMAQAEANVSRDEAQLRNAETDARRQQELVKAGIVARSVYDTSRTAADVYKESARADRAAITSARANLAADEAALEKAKLDLSFCEIRSPIAGRTGNVLVQAGNYVKGAGDTTLVVINQLQPIFVSFSVPEQQLAVVRRLGEGHRLGVRAGAKDEPGRQVEGVLTVIDNTVDATTGMIRLKATFANAERVLWPGQFVNVTLTLEARKDAVVVPSEAVQAGQKGSFVYVVKADQSVEARVVKTGAMAGNKIVIEDGVQAGETVVTDGQLLLAPGVHVFALPAGGMPAAKAGAGKS
jgi:multidrug efflux system membrane fusion protein